MRHAVQHSSIVPAFETEKTAAPFIFRLDRAELPEALVDSGDIVEEILERRRAMDFGEPKIAVARDHERLALASGKRDRRSERLGDRSGVKAKHSIAVVYRSPQHPLKPGHRSS